jgi:anaerobic magnesium-protoporphyrin IX monomethyl ester cyclase
MKVLLCLPPDYDHNYPPLGTPALVGFLKRKEVNAIQVDLNLAYRVFLMGKIKGRGLSAADKENLLHPLLKEFFNKKLKNRYYSKFLPRRSGRSFADLPYDNNSNSSFHFTEQLLSSKYLFRYLQDEQDNTFYQFYRAHQTIPFLKKEDIRVLGISVISPQQAIAALTLGFLVKKEVSGIHVTLGGQWVTLFRKELTKRKDLFACFDSLVAFEGETPLYELIKAIGKQEEPKAPNIITKKTRQPVFDSRGEDLNRLACPDFSGLPLKDYNASVGGVKLTYETSRGCYWNKCAYCVDLPLPKPAYRVKRADIVVKEIKELVNKYAAKELLMGDPGMSPRQMLAISRALIRNKVKVKWWTMARLDPGFSKEHFTTAKRAGLNKINFGFESACDKVCDFLQKGNRREVSTRIIKDCSIAGIMVDLQTIVGMPGETPDDAMDTVSFLIEHKKNIAAVTFNVYYLTPGNYVYRRPVQYGIDFDKKKVLPFQFMIPFKNKRGMTKGQAQVFINLYYQLLAGNNKLKTPGKGLKDRVKQSGWATLSLIREEVGLRWQKYSSGNMVIK